MDPRGGLPAIDFCPLDEYPSLRLFFRLDRLSYGMANLLDRPFWAQMGLCGNTASFHGWVSSLPFASHVIKEAAYAVADTDIP